jgi:hypothetical protein
MKKNLSDLMRLVSLAVVIILVAPAMISAQEKKVDFAGTWALNSMKSSPSAANSGGITVKHEGNSLVTTTTRMDGMSQTNKYSLDGKESINKSDGVEHKSTAKFSEDGKTLTIITKSLVDGREHLDKDVWTLVDPKTLSIECTVSGTSGDEVTEYVYDKR